MLSQTFYFGSACLWSMAFLMCGTLWAEGENEKGGDQDALKAYVEREDPHFTWKEIDRRRHNGFDIAHLELVSQEWRGHRWEHYMVVARPERVTRPDAALLFITGDGNGLDAVERLEYLAGQAGATAAIITQVPNQPLFDGRREDALIAYTFEQYRQSGDSSWPLLFPMVKSAVRGMDAVQEYGEKTHGDKIERFVVTGASKRGWTTWLTGAVDPRVAAIAPIVIDVLNMTEHIDWSIKMFGKPSEQIHDYTDLRLHLRLDEPMMSRLRTWIDPYSYRSEYRMPKLVLLGTNDRYWVVDSTRHYWEGLPEPKLLFQTPNAGHGLDGGKAALRTLGAFFGMIAAKEPLPRMQWQFSEGSSGMKVEGAVKPSPKGLRLWTAESDDRDFRDDTWRDQPLAAPSDNRFSVEVPAPEKGYRAFFVEAVMEDANGEEYRLSTEVRVAPDGLRDEGASQ